MQSSFFDHVETFLNTLNRQGKSAHTVAAYRRDLNQLKTLLPETESDEPLRRLHFVAALKKLSQRNSHPRSMARKLSAWRQYGQWQVKHQLLDCNPCESLKPPKPPQRLPKAVEQETLNRLLDAGSLAADNDETLALRDQAIFELMYGSGLRLSEIHQLDLTDISLQEGWIKVSGKGNKERHVPLVKKSIEAVQRYLPQRCQHGNETALFTNRNGKRLSQRQIQHRLRDWAVRRESPQHLSPHMMRHSYASHLLQSARDIRAVQELLGHSNLSSTQIYTKLDFDHLAQVYDQTHPRAKKKK
ncbi:tyrosine-type recombinase/integrase [Neisseria weaveri]|uniref:tyrosine-type recombinase/integrase n=1 Tax=Neisseria weaveri TaxID=28091 RepID=UPI0007C9A0BE|nr:tyrosine-type recombinase/integrase [Neisseria weaveri]SAY51602.1 site-specific recombinase [Neisseria weaveri]